MQLMVDHVVALHAAVSEQAGRCGGGPTRCRSTSNAPPPPASADACKERPSLQWQQRQQLSSVGHEAEAKAEVEVGAEVEVEGDADAEAEAEAALSHLRANLEPFLHLSEAAEVGLVVGTSAGGGGYARSQGRG